MKLSETRTDDAGFEINGDVSKSGTQNGADDANESGNGLWDQQKEALRKSRQY